MAKENQPQYDAHLHLDDVDGDVKIGNDVIAAIAGLAATEVEGVARMASGLTNELIGKLGMKNQRAGVEIRIEEDHVSAELSIIIRYGYSIPKTAKAIQERVKSAVDSMTGLAMDQVNVHIVGVDIEKA